MNTYIVGIGGLHASNTSGDVIKTLALGSCVGVVILAPRQRAIGLAHIALPLSDINTDLANQKPAMFADTGIPILIQAMEKFGCLRNDLLVKLIGGASILDFRQHFEIGKKNILAIKKSLWKYKLGALSEDVGDEISRTVTVEVDTGRVIITSPNRGAWEI